MSLAITTKVWISKFANLAQLPSTKRNELQHSRLWAKPPKNWSVLIGLLIEYFNMKRGEGKKSHLCLTRTKRQKVWETVAGHFYWYPSRSSADSISAKEKHEMPLPCHQGRAKDCSVKKYLYCVSPSLLKGVMCTSFRHWHSHTEGWLGCLSVQIQVSGFKKKTREKRCESSS